MTPTLSDPVSTRFEPPIALNAIYAAGRALWEVRELDASGTVHLQNSSGYWAACGIAALRRDCTLVEAEG